MSRFRQATDSQIPDRRPKTGSASLPMLCSDFVTNPSFARSTGDASLKFDSSVFASSAFLPPRQLVKLEQVVVVDELPSVKTESPPPKGYKFGFTEGRCSVGPVSRFTELKNSLR